MKIVEDRISKYFWPFWDAFSDCALELESIVSWINQKVKLTRIFAKNDYFDIHWGCMPAVLLRVLVLFGSNN